MLHVTSLTLEELETDKFKRAKLYGSWANLISESSTEIVTSEWFKRLTDGTLITVDRKNGHPFQMSSRAKLILDVNELPSRDNELRAFYRRVITIIDFPNLLEGVMSPTQIGDFVQKMKDPEELDRIFSYVVDHYYEQIESSMKFTRQLSLAEAEQKWEERSNPAKSYLKMKNEAGEILTDVDSVREILIGNTEKEKRYITHENGGEEYLTMIKNDVIADAVKWATLKGFPAKTIHGGTLGSALVSMGFPNETVNKKVSKGTTLKAWKKIYVHIDHDQVADCQNHPLPQEKQSQIDESQFGDGAFLLPAHKREEHEYKGGKMGETSHQTANSLYKTEEKQVTGNFHDPPPEPSPLNAGNGITNNNNINETLPREFSDKELKSFRDYISYLLEYAPPVNEIDNIERNMTSKFGISTNDFNTVILKHTIDSGLAKVNGKHLEKVSKDYKTIYRKTEKSMDITALSSEFAELYIKVSQHFTVNS